MTNQIFSSLKVVVLAIVLSLGLSYVYAWTAPAGTPPTGNVNAPLNTSSEVQSKTGTLRVDLGGSGTSFVGTGNESNFIVDHDAGTRFTKFRNTASPSSANSGFQFTDGTVAGNPIATFTNLGNVGIGTATPLRALHVNGELSISRSDKVGFINISDESGNGGGTLYLRGINNNGSSGYPAYIILDGRTDVVGSLYVNGTPVTGITCNWTGERMVYGNGGGCTDDRGITCTAGIVTSMRMSC